MPKKLPDISTIEECPHCGSNFGYYTRSYASGWIHDNTLFEKDPFTGKGEKYNTGMFDSLDYGKFHSTCFCMECDKAIGKEVNNEQQ